MGSKNPLHQINSAYEETLTLERRRELFRVP
jgi:hypothetical protein